MISLVGYTGFVGSNIYSKGRDAIREVYNSQNIEAAYGKAPDILIYAGMRAEKYLANTNPEDDLQLVYQAEENIRKIHPQKLVLISTIDVFKNPSGKDEDAEIDTNGLCTYGLNRYRLEQWVRRKYQDALIVRLPGLYGSHIKKNFIFDFLNVIPSMLKEAKFKELSAKDAELEKYYELQGNGFYRCINLAEEERKLLQDKFKNLGFTALNFTDSRSVYQFYPLSRLWKDIKTALNVGGIGVWHAATEPVSAGEVYEYLTGKPFINEITTKPASYDYRTKYDQLYGGSNGYLMKKGQVLKDIRKFVEGSVI